MSKLRIEDHIQPWHLIGVFMLFISLGFLCSWQGDRTIAVPKNPGSQPLYGWMVKEDLGVGQVPDGPVAQRFLVRELSGWEVLTYCLEPDDTPPPVGTACEMTDEDTFYCGDSYQRLRQYAIQQTPPPAATSTATMTRTMTKTKITTLMNMAAMTSPPTSTSTFTPTSTSTSTPTSTNTPTPTSTCTPKPTSTSTLPPNLEHTPTPRPKPGGDGNLRSGEIVRGILGVILFGLGGVLGWVEWQKAMAKKKE